MVEGSGPWYPDWGVYTDHGKLKTVAAHRIAFKRIPRYARGAQTEILIEHSTTFLSRMPDHHFDWVYLNSTHSYEGTRDELQLLRSKLKPGGILAGDDSHERPDHLHSGVAQAVKDAIARGEYGESGLSPRFSGQLEPDPSGVDRIGMERSR